MIEKYQIGVEDAGGEPGLGLGGPAPFPAGRVARRMLSTANVLLADAQLAPLSVHGRFASACDAGHAAAGAARCWHGYHSEDRATVLRCLPYTLGWPVERWRVLDAAHEQRNLACWEGCLEPDEYEVAELIELVQRLVKDV